MPRRTTPRSPQPLKDVVKASPYTFRELADKIGCSFDHLFQSSEGRVVPNDRVRELAPILLDTPIEHLYTADRLARKHRVRSCRRKPVAS